MGTPETSDDPGMIDVARRFPGPGNGPLAAPRPGHRDGPCRRDQPRGPDPRGPRRRRRLADLRPDDGRQPPAGRRSRCSPRPASGSIRSTPISIDLCLLDPAMPARRAGRRRSRRHVASLVPGPGAGDREPGQHGPGADGRASPGDHRGLGRRRGRNLRRSRRPALAARVDPLAVPPRRRGLPRASRRSQRRDLRAAAVRAVHQLPQIAKRFGFRFALHLGFDAGRFPIRPETKRLWESPDGSSLETLLGLRWPPIGRRRGCCSPGGWPRR